MICTGILNCFVLSCVNLEEIMKQIYETPVVLVTVFAEPVKLDDTSGIELPDDNIGEEN